MKAKKNIFILQGNPDKDTLCGSIAEQYKKGAEAEGHEVKLLNLGDLTFDPILHDGYKKIQELEPDLKKVQEDIKWCDHLLLIYPTWWSSMPALLKGFFDRTWLPGFAFHMHKSGMGWEKLLVGKSAHVLITMDSWPLVSRLLFGDSTNEIGRAILKFAGFSPVRIEKIGPVKNMSDDHLKKILKSAEELGKIGK